MPGECRPPNFGAGATASSIGWQTTSKASVPCLGPGKARRCPRGPGAFGPEGGRVVRNVVRRLSRSDCARNYSCEQSVVLRLLRDIGVRARRVGRAACGRAERQCHGLEKARPPRPSWKRSPWTGCGSLWDFGGLCRGDKRYGNRCPASTRGGRARTSSSPKRATRGCPPHRQRGVNTTAEAHSSVAKAAIALGLGREGVRTVGTGSGRAMDVAALAEAIDRDIASGCRAGCDHRHYRDHLDNRRRPGGPYRGGGRDRGGCGSMWMRPMRDRRPRFPLGDTTSMGGKGPTPL